MSIEWMQKLSASRPGTVTKKDVHDMADEKGVVWDSDKPGSQDFLRMSMRVTGKTHLDDMDDQELRRVHATLEKKAGHVEDRMHQRAPGAGPDIRRLRKALKRMHLRRGETYHYDLPRGRGSAVIGPTRGGHVVKTVYSPGMKPPGTWLPPRQVSSALEKRAAPMPGLIVPGRAAPSPGLLAHMRQQATLPGVSPGALSSMRQELRGIGQAAPASVAANVRARIAQFLKQQGLPSNTRYAVGSGTGQSLLGMRRGQPIRDIDILVDRLPKGRQNLDVGGVDAWTNWRDPRLTQQAFDSPVMVHGIPVMRPETTLNFKNIIKRDPRTPKGANDARDISQLQAYLAQKRGLRKFGAADGHWRKLPQGQEGHDQGGNPTQGRTWVRKNRMRKGMKPMAHQADFSKAVQQQLGGKQGGGIIAAHGTGTGKTFGAINAFEQLKGQGKARRALVIVPAGLRENFLASGVNKFTTSKGVILTKPSEVSADTEYVVVSYTAFRLRPQEWLDKVKPDTIIADEVQRATNPDGKTHKALLLARKQVPHFMGLTASVVQNKPDEIVPLLSLATGGTQQLQTKKQFNRAHMKKQVSKTRGIFGGRTYEKKLVEQAKLRASVGGSIHYIEDLDASKKPRKDVETVEVLMSDQQTAQYRKAMKGVDPVVAKKIAEGEPVSQKQAMNVFMKLMRARQVSNSLHLTTAGMTLAQAAEKTPKIKKILDDAVRHIKKTPDAQVIMYTNLVHGGVDVLEAGLKARGIPYGIFAGKRKGITEESRQQAVTDYQNKKNKVIIITGAGAEGLSLGDTTMVQLVDGHYNPERMAQAEARGIRAGGLSHRPMAKRRVRVKRYVSSLDKTWWQSITFQGPEKSVGQWVYRTAAKKDRLNQQLRGVLRDRSAHEKKRRDSRLYRWMGGGP